MVGEHIMVEIRKSYRGHFGCWIGDTGVFVCSGDIFLVAKKHFKIKHEAKGTAERQLKSVAELLGLNTYQVSTLWDTEGRSQLFAFLEGN